MEHKWYVVHTYSNFENKAKRSLEERIKAYTCEDEFSGILVPSEQFVNLVQGKKKTTSRRCFPGYILVKMELTDKTWHVVMGTPKVTGFVGGKNSPSTISDEEVERLKTQIEGKIAAREFECEFACGDQVNVIEGPFQNFNGVVDDVRPDKEKVKVLVSIFGRSTPVELNFDQITKK
ncbi:MAG: transcription termination/antitermination protein NusG [Thermodesulfobacteriota bacterium]|nr:transcription termination/antitermination protein NusG [Thermodesulfobacteriota bacterium]